MNTFNPNPVSENHEQTEAQGKDATDLRASGKSVSDGTKSYLVLRTSPVTLLSSKAPGQMESLRDSWG